MRGALIKWEMPIWWGLVIGAFVYSIIFGGKDWETIYRPAALGDYAGHPLVGNPLYLLFFFWPLARFLPVNVGGAIIVLFTLLVIHCISQLTGVNRWLITFSYPALWMIKMAQIDAFILLGVVIGWWSIEHDKPYWQGVATLLLLLKPQIGAPISVVFLVWQHNWRAFVISSLVFMASLAVFGFWPLPWFEKLLTLSQGATTGGDFAITGNSISLFPYGAFFFLLILLPFYSRKERTAAIIAATMLSVPYAAYYSILAAMAFPLPLCIYIVISLPLLGSIGWWALLGPISIIVFPLIKKVIETMYKPVS